MMKRKILSFLCIITTLCGMMTFNVSADNVPSECHSELVGYILPEFSKKEGNVTRSEFVDFLIQLRYGNQSNTATAFKDVDEYSVASGEIELARELGIIESSDMFYPDLPITLNQANKVSVTLLGYKKIAELNGGYPAGYAKTASGLEIFSGISTDKYITWEMFEEIIYNILNTPQISATFSGGEMNFEVDENSSLLKEKYEIYEFSGIQTANYLTSLTSSEENTQKGAVIVNGEEYKYEGSDYLGYNVKGYYQDNDGEKTIITMRPYRNEEIALKTEDIELFSQNSLTYFDGRGTKSEKIYPGYSFIYNHKAYGKTDIEDLISTAEAELIFIDADRDDKYETIKMLKKDYLAVKNVNTFDMIISGKDVSQGIIKLDGEVIYEITKNNNEASIYDIVEGELLCYTVSDDLMYYEINAVYNELSGRISAINKEDKKITVEGEEYSYNSYFKNQHEVDISVGVQAVFLLDDDGNICLITDISNTYMYGWIVRKWEDETDGEACLKIFTQNGNMSNYKLSDSVVFDGEKAKTPAAIDLQLDFSDDKKRFVRYYVNSDNEITKIDFSKQATGELPFNEKKQENNYLTCFYENTNSTYLSSGKIFSQLCKLSDSCRIFIIPESEEKRNDENNYLSVTSGYFSNNVTYKVNVYDIDETDGAEAVVIFDDRNSLQMEAASAVVESVEMTLNADDEVTYVVSLLKDASFINLVASDDVAQRASELNCGDIIRYSRSSDNKLLAFSLEYDCMRDLLLAQDSNQVKYRKGYVYSYNNGYATILEKPTLSGYTYKDMSFTYFGNVKPSHIYLTLSSDGSVRKATVRNQPDNVIKSYRATGAECDRIITRSRFEALNSVWIYHIEN